MASVAAAQSAFPLSRLPKVRCNPLLSSLVFFACDTFAILLTGISVTVAGGGSLHIPRLVMLWPAAGIFLAVFAYSNLYPGIIYNGVAELRRLGVGLTLCFLVVAAMLVTTRGADKFARATLCVWWLSAIVITPFLRSVVRGWVCRKPWWGIPVAVFNTGEESAGIIRELETHPEMGLRPVVILSSSVNPSITHRLPVVDMRYAAAIRGCGIDRAMIALPKNGPGKLLEELETFESIFPRLMIVQSSIALYNLTVHARQLGDGLAVEVRRDLLLPIPRLVKRVMELLIVCFSLPLVGLTVLLLGILVRLESPGPAFYGHRRVGRAHSTFLTWKIRTMQVDGDKLLEDAMAGDAALRTEWQRDRKLRHDPRVTRVGTFLRKTSLDELPQLWNVLRGEMSLVGPRPIVEDEIAAYGLNFSLYCRVTPGLTGLWQVSGRNDVSLGDRVRLDSYYVRNWSPWLDLHILARTAKVVFTGQGAY